MPVGPYSQDVLTRIYNVHWGGGTIFAVGDKRGFIWVVSIGNETEAKEKTLEKVGQIGPDVFEDGEPGVFLGGSFGVVESTEEGLEKQTPTFLLCGYHYVLQERGLWPNGVIISSNDGRTWTRAWDYTVDNGSRKLPTYMIWDHDEKQFYLTMDCLSPSVPGEDSVGSYECWSSSDGKSWTVVEKDIAYGTIPPAFNAHCPFKWAGTESSLDGNGIPDGNFGLDPSLKDSTETPAVGKIVKDEGHLITSADYLATGYLPGITFASQCWGRLGHKGRTGLDVSFDHAENWVEVKGEVPGLGFINGFAAGVIGDARL